MTYKISIDRVDVRHVSESAMESFERLFFYTATEADAFRQKIKSVFLLESRVYREDLA
jgi:hypothetical protein